MNLVILLLASFSLFAGTFESKLRDLDRCLDNQKDVIDQHMQKSSARSRLASDRLSEVRKKYEDQYTITQVVGFLASTVSFDACAEDPESSRTVVGKLKGYQKRSADLWEVKNMIYDWKYFGVNAGFDVADYLHGRRRDPKKLKQDLLSYLRKSDAAARKINALAKVYGHSYPAPSCSKLAAGL